MFVDDFYEYICVLLLIIQQNAATTDFKCWMNGLNDRCLLCAFENGPYDRSIEVCIESMFSQQPKTSKRYIYECHWVFICGYITTMSKEVRVVHHKTWSMQSAQHLNCIERYAVVGEVSHPENMLLDLAKHMRALSSRRDNAIAIAMT